MNSSGRISVKTALEIMQSTDQWNKILSIENGKKENGKKTSTGETAIYKKSGLEGLIDRFSKRLSEDDLNNLNDVLSLLNNDKGGIKSEDSLKKKFAPNKRRCL